jgi:hypothetical protein
VQVPAMHAIVILRGLRIGSPVTLRQVWIEFQTVEKDVQIRRSSASSGSELRMISRLLLWNSGLGGKKVWDRDVGERFVGRDMLRRGDTVLTAPERPGIEVEVPVCFHTQLE